MKNQMLGGLSTAQFLRDYWQKKPLLIRHALPTFNGFLSKEKLISLSFQDEVQARLVSFHRKKWTLLNGPFKKRDFGNHLGNWALLVQGVNYFLPEGEALLKKFNFIPHARLDDLMVSFAPEGGGVGPHFDSYDVFLLQGMGKRLWKISEQKDRRLLPNAPLRILKNFNSEQEWLLEPGDMLYLPPNYAHHGIAVGDCITYSIGFRAPMYQELVQEFLIYLQDHCKIEGIYQDPELKLAKHPAKISDEMIEKISSIIKKINFTKKDIESFLGIYLTEPKSHIFFNRPEIFLTKNNFLKLIKQNGICLDLKSQMLFTNKIFFMNGESYLNHDYRKFFFKKLADDREIEISNEIDNKTVNLLYEWYEHGYLRIRKKST